MVAPRGHKISGEFRGKFGRYIDDLVVASCVIFISRRL